MKYIILVSLLFIGCGESKPWPGYKWKERLVCVKGSLEESQVCSNNAIGGAVAGAVIGGLITGKTLSKTGAIVGGLAGSSPKCRIVTKEKCFVKKVIVGCFKPICENCSHGDWVENINCSGLHKKDI